MRIFGTICVLIYCFYPVVSSANTFIKKNVLGYNIEVIEFQTDSLDFELKVAVDETGGSSLKEIMKSIGGISGVTGVFQCPKDYSACGGKNFTINERYINGEKIGTYDSTGQRVVFGWDTAYKAFIFQTGEINKERESEIFEGLANHPLLLLDGVPMTESYWKKGLIDSKMREKGTRNFICSNIDSSKFYFGLVHTIDIDHLPIILRSFGCHNAINLDAGYSTAMIYNGRYTTGPGREILDGVFIVPKNMNTQTLDEAARKIVLKIHKKIRIRRQEKRIQILEGVNQKIVNFLDRVYKKHEKDILEENLIGEVQKIGTKVSFSSEAITRIYLLNSLKYGIQEQIQEYKKEIIQRDNTPNTFDLRF